MNNIAWATQAKPGSTKNEDLFGFVGDFFWLLDGATSVDGPALAKDAHWLVNDLNRRLAASWATIETLAELAARVCTDAAGDWFDAGLKPSAAMALWRVRDGALDAVFSGNVSLLIDDGNGVVELTDSRTLAGHEGKDLPLLEACARGVEFESDEFRALRRQMKQAEVEAFGNYRGWLMTPDQRSPSDFICVRRELRGPVNIVAATDGFMELRAYLQLSDADFVGLIKTTPLPELFRQLREYAAMPTSGQRLPRTKRADDATAVVIEICESELLGRI